MKKFYKPATLKLSFIGLGIVCFFLFLYFMAIDSVGLGVSSIFSVIGFAVLAVLAEEINDLIIDVRDEWK